MFFKTQIGLSLCVLCLKEFYNIYDNEGVGIITNTRSGALLFDLLEWMEKESIKNEEEVIYNVVAKDDIKAVIWEDCCRDYKVIYNRDIKDKEVHKQARNNLYKARLIEYWLNKQADEDKRIMPADINIPKLNTQYHRFRLIRES